MTRSTTNSYQELAPRTTHLPPWRPVAGASRSGWAARCSPTLAATHRHSPSRSVAIQIMHGVLIVLQGLGLKVGLGMEPTAYLAAVSLPCPACFTLQRCCPDLAQLRLIRCCRTAPPPAKQWPTCTCTSCRASPETLSTTIRCTTPLTNRPRRCPGKLLSPGRQPPAASD